MEDVSSEVVRALNDSLRNPLTGESNAALVRLFMTVPHHSLDSSRQQFVANTFPDLVLDPDTRCLTLLGTVGDEAAWCTVDESEGHQAIPLMNAESVSEIPMIARLLSEFELDVEQVLRPGPDMMLEEESAGFRFFHVEDAKDSPFIPGQEFVTDKGIRSVLGFGGFLFTGHLFTVIVFSKVHISRETANLFRAVALGVRLAILPLVEERIIACEQRSLDEAENLRAIAGAQSELLKVFRSTVQEQSEKLDETLTDLQAANGDLQDTLDELRETQSRLVDVESRLVSKYAVEKLRDPSTYKVAFTVGTLISLFGHFLVPYLRGQTEVLSLFMNELNSRPILAAISIAIAYVFPVIVQVHSAVRSRMSGRLAELRAAFPDSKPDPVFRAAPDGHISDAGANTRVLLNRHGLNTAQEVLGTELWQQVLEHQRAGRRLARGTHVRIDALGDTYYVAHSPAADGAVNLYLTEAEVGAGRN